MQINLTLKQSVTLTALCFRNNACQINLVHYLAEGWGEDINGINYSVCKLYWNTWFAEITKFGAPIRIYSQRVHADPWHLYNWLLDKTWCKFQRRVWKISVAGSMLLKAFWKFCGVPAMLQFLLFLSSLSLFDRYDDVIKWKHFSPYWPFVRGIYRSPVNSLHKCQWRGALIFSFTCAWINSWVNNRGTGDLKRHRPHYDAIAMISVKYAHAVVSARLDRIDAVA